MSDPHHIQLVWRLSGEYEKIVNQREAREPETIQVQLNSGDFLPRAGTPILVSVGRGTRSYPPRPEVSEVESTHASRRDRSKYALPSIVI